jgi:hypothetical protein
MLKGYSKDPLHLAEFPKVPGNAASHRQTWRELNPRDLHRFPILRTNSNYAGRGIVRIATGICAFPSFIQRKGGLERNPALGVHSLRLDRASPT